MPDLARTSKQIGNTIRRTRKQRGLSQAALGALAGLRQETISLIEAGNQSARLDSLLAVMECLGLELQIGPRATDWNPETYL